VCQTPSKYIPFYQKRFKNKDQNTHFQKKLVIIPKNLIIPKKFIVIIPKNIALNYFAIPKDKS